MTTSLHMFGRYYKGMAIAVLVLAAVHVLLSFVFSAMSYRKNLNKQGGAWLFSFGICVAILVLSAIATGQKENFDELDATYPPSNTMLGGCPTSMSFSDCVHQKGGVMPWSLAEKTDVRHQNDKLDANSRMGGIGGPWGDGTV